MYAGDGRSGENTTINQGLGVLNSHDLPGSASGSSPGWFLAYTAGQAFAFFTHCPQSNLGACLLQDILVLQVKTNTSLRKLCRSLQLSCTGLTHVCRMDRKANE